MKAYKLTDQDMKTYNDTQWILNEWKETSGDGELCSGGWLHCYSDPILGLMLNPIHADITNPRLFIVECEGESKNDKGLKMGYTRMRLIEELDIPLITNVNLIAFGIMCAKEVYKKDSWLTWADRWLDGTDRTHDAAYAAANAATNAYANADAFAAANAANAAANAAYATASGIDLISIAHAAMEVV